ncbi:MAG: hypothetical protein V2A54_16380 [Bacteroidota bacterium]
MNSNKIKAFGLLITLTSIIIKVFFLDHYSEQRVKTQNMFTDYQTLTTGAMLNDILLFGNTDFKGAPGDIPNQAINYNNATALMITASVETDQKVKERMIINMNQRCKEVKTMDQYKIFRQYCMQLQKETLDDFQKQYNTEESNLSLYNTLVIIFTILGSLLLVIGEFIEARKPKFIPKHK